MRKLDHIGIAVGNLDEAMERFAKILEVEFSEPETLPEQGVKLSMADVGGARIELLEPLEPDSSIGRFIEKKGEGLHHLAFKTNDLEEALTRLAADGLQLIDLEPRPGAHSSRIAFLHPRSTAKVLVELVEE
ncbi:MAG: methylmalonyl-CoA epimerase [Gemmatimonadota bacterium]|nr:methylmalonyl-CoA epimerase [Gemmatimonadota bacterium]